MDRRATFFFLAAVLCAFLIQFIPVEEGKASIVWVGWALAGGYFVLGVLSALDSWSRSRDRR